jgi:hypothetical protein
MIGSVNTMKPGGSVGSLAVPAWMRDQKVAGELASCVGRLLDTGYDVGVGRVVRLNAPSTKFRHGSITVENAAGQKDTLDFVRMYDRLQNNESKWLQPLSKMSERSRFPAHLAAVVAGDALWCSLDKCRVRFVRMVEPTPAIPGEWMVEVSDNWTGKVLPDYRHPTQVRVI